jgi:hypothetical protein
LISERNQLTKSEKRIANYLNQNQDEAAFISAGEIAERLHLSEATMVRLHPILIVTPPCEWLQENLPPHDPFCSYAGRLDDLRGRRYLSGWWHQIDYLTEACKLLTERKRGC